MTLDDLTRLVRAGEGPQLEFKTKIPEGARFAKEIAAFANTRGGTLLSGVADDGTIAGVRDREEELFTLHSILEEYCHPTIEIEIDAVRISRRREVILVRVPRSRNRPHFVRTEDRDIVYIRSMDKSIEASSEALRLMKLDDANADVTFEFGEHELLLMRYLEEYGKVTVEQFARIANLPTRDASEKLVLLTRADILNIHPSEQNDFFTAARSKAG